MKKKISFTKFTLIMFFGISVFSGAIAGGLTSLYASDVHRWFASTVMRRQPIDYVRESGDAQTYPIIFNEESSTTDVVKNVSPAVVSIIIKKDVTNMYNVTGPNIFPFNDFFNFGFPIIPQPQSDVPLGERGQNLRRVGGGTGFIISKDGLILTNKHVVLDESAQYIVMLQDGIEYDAEILGTDQINDIAVLKIKPDGELPVIDLGDSDSIEIGQTVIAIGYALGEFPNSVTRGIVSGIGRRVVAGDGMGSNEVIEEAIQTDAAINPGNSGGPLLNIAGQVIAINTAVSGAGQSVGFAIPINSAKRVVDSVLKYGKIVRPFLGIRYVLINERIAKANQLNADHGALIARGEQRTDFAVIPGSPADKAGLVENDIILDVNGKNVTEKNSLVKLLANYQPGDEITLTVLHKGKEKKVSVILDEYKN